MCGNGSRCFGRFVQRLTGAPKGFTFETRAGVIAARFQGEDVAVTLTAPKDLRLNETVKLSIGLTAIHSLDTGVPHAVLFVPDADKAMVQSLGAEIRHHPHFAPRGTNVNFVQLLGHNAHPRPHLRARRGGRNAGLRHRRDGLGPDRGGTAPIAIARAGAGASGRAIGSEL